MSLGVMLVFGVMPVVGFMPWSWCRVLRARIWCWPVFLLLLAVLPWLGLEAMRSEDTSNSFNKAVFREALVPADLALFGLCGVKLLAFARHGGEVGGDLAVAEVAHRICIRMPCFGVVLWRLAGVFVFLSGFDWRRATTSWQELGGVSPPMVDQSWQIPASCRMDLAVLNAAWLLSSSGWLQECGNLVLFFLSAAPEFGSGERCGGRERGPARTTL